MSFLPSKEFLLVTAMKKFLLSGLLFVSILFASDANALLKVVYPNVNGEAEKHFGYAALRLALEKSGVDFELTLRKRKVTNSRIRILLAEKEISISDFGTCKEFEETLSPIYFPIDLGLNGWRLFLIHEEHQKQFDRIETKEDLKKMRAGQGVGWSDTEILKNAGLEVLQAPHLENLFRMTQEQRFDYLPLGANEAHFLLDLYRKECPHVAVEEGIVLIYPFARFFFVHKDNKELHDAVETGLIKAFEDGSFMELFKSHNSNATLFTKANLKQRRIITLDNPNLNDNFKRIPKKYFFSMEMLN